MSIPSGISIPPFSAGDFAAFFTQIRCLPATAGSQEVVEEGLEQLADAAVAAASLFVIKALQANTYASYPHQVTAPSPIYPKGNFLDRISGQLNPIFRA